MSVNLPREDTDDVPEEKKEDNGNKGVGKPKKHIAIRGKEEKLGSNVFSYGHIGQAEMYIKTMQELVEFVGKRYGKDMRHLLKYLKECGPDKPEVPKEAASKSAATEYELMVWKSEYNEDLRKKSRYDDDKVRCSY